MSKKQISKTKPTDNCCKTMEYPDHSNLVPNLNRIAGQIEGIKKMITDKRYCVDILQQFKSVKSAIGGVEAKMLEIHMDSCVTAAFNSNNEKDKLAKISELKDLYRNK
jgi:CsoR family transcriptional regulator, copper-sensing transcriptional repressor